MLDPGPNTTLIRLWRALVFQTDIPAPIPLIVASWSLAKVGQMETIHQLRVLVIMSITTTDKRASHCRSWTVRGLTRLTPQRYNSRRKLEGLDPIVPRPTVRFMDPMSKAKSPSTTQKYRPETVPEITEIIKLSSYKNCF